MRPQRHTGVLLVQRATFNNSDTSASSENRITAAAGFSGEGDGSLALTDKGRHSRRGVYQRYRRPRRLWRYFGHTISKIARQRLRRDEASGYNTHVETKGRVPYAPLWSIRVFDSARAAKSSAQANAADRPLRRYLSAEIKYIHDASGNLAPSDNLIYVIGNHGYLKNPGGLFGENESEEGAKERISARDVCGPVWTFYMKDCGSRLEADAILCSHLEISQLGDSTDRHAPARVGDGPDAASASRYQREMIRYHSGSNSLHRRTEIPPHSDHLIINLKTQKIRLPAVLCEVYEHSRSPGFLSLDSPRTGIERRNSSVDDDEMSQKTCAELSRQYPVLNAVDKIPSANPRRKTSFPGSTRPWSRFWLVRLIRHCRKVDARASTDTLMWTTLRPKSTISAAG
ncbi:hypothetical protein B0H10DRAFT_1953752 [Mycena sp. CBHHK59/15]|nr:hypothetical protein B0H10DRAFT_1953752 [Mycena sp. CBHHK59/15]